VGIRELFRRDGAVAAATRLPIPPPPTGGDSWVSPWQAEPNDLGSVLLAELYGFKLDEADHLPVTRSEAMSVAAIARIRRTICTTVGRLPLLTYSGMDLVADPVRSGYAPVAQPEAGRPSAITFAWIAEAVWFYGRAWLVVTGRYADTNRPASFEWVPEWRAKLADGQLVGHTDGRSFEQRDVIRIDGPDEGLLTFGARTIRGAARLERAAVRTSDNPVPTIDLHYTGTDPMSDDEIDVIIDRFRQARQASPIGWTSGAIEAKPLAMSVEQLLIDGRRAAALDCARVGGVPAWVVDVGVEGSSLTYSNTASRSRELIDYGVAWILDAIAGRLSLDDVLPRGVWCQFDTDVLLRDDFAGRMTSYEIAQRSGVYTTEELRSKERGRPMEGDGS
jgi:hypothetical protein